MKKSVLILCLLLLLGIFCPNSARAQLYIGGDYTRSHINYESDYESFYNDNYNSLGPVVGINVNGIGVEGFYQTSNKHKNNFGYESDFKVYGAEFILALPTSELIDFVASLGFVKYEFEYSGENGQTINEDAEAVRFGLGFQVNFTKHLAFRSMYHYSSINSNIDKFEDVSEFTAGFRFYF